MPPLYAPKKMHNLFSRLSNLKNLQKTKKLQPWRPLLRSFVHWYATGQDWGTHSWYIIPYDAPPKNALNMFYSHRYCLAILLRSWCIGRWTKSAIRLVCAINPSINNNTARIILITCLCWYIVAAGYIHRSYRSPFDATVSIWYV